MARIAVLRGFSAARKKKHAKKAARKSHTDKAHTPQALKFKAKIAKCAHGRPKTSSVTLKEFYSCLRK